MIKSISQMHWAGAGGRGQELCLSELENASSHELTDPV